MSEKLIEVVGKVKTNQVDNTQFPYFEPNSEYTVVRWEHSVYVINKLGMPQMLTPNVGMDTFSYNCNNDKGTTELFLDMSAVVSEIAGWKTAANFVEDAS